MQAHDRTQAAERLFAELLDLEPAQRTARLAQACAGMDSLRAEVEALMDAAGRGADYLEGLRRRLGLAEAAAGDKASRETGQFADAPGAPGATAEQPGVLVGPFRLLSELGRGGMGSVWLAERTDLLQGRQVALKLPHLEGGAWPRAGLAERLARERSILATLEHPNIARLYDAGLTPAGQPWLALELVHGERIDAYCRTRALPVRERLVLFAQVARAVAHAHAQLVVHRDLKPANVLVTESAGVAEVKLLDFGIAKLLHEGAPSDAAAAPTPEGDLTREVGRALTPNYASPEQILGQPVGTASDVYSLGVLLYELLADARPYKLARATPAALEEAIAAGDVPRPSSRAPAARRRQLRGDLDTIVLKALKRAPAERYTTVAAFAEDVQRHLAHEPVLARPDSLTYRAGRFVRRHRLPVGAAAALMAALLAGVAGTAWQARLALAEQQRAEAVKDFVAGLLTDVDPFSSRSRSPTLEGLLQSAQQRLDLATGVTPSVRVELLLTIGGSYAGLEQLDPAEALLDQALAEARRDLGAGHELEQRVRLARLKVLRHRGRLAEMRAELDTLLPVLRAGRSPARQRLLQEAVTMSAHLAMDEGEHEAARESAQASVNLATNLYGEQHPVVVDALVVLATATQFLGDAEATLQQATRARSLATQVHGADHAKVLDARILYGVSLHDAGRFHEARLELEDVLARLQGRMGPEAPSLAYVANDLSRIALDLGDEPAALRHAELSLRIHRRNAAPDSHPVTMARRQHGIALLALYRSEEAAVELEQVVRALTALRGADAPLVLSQVALLAAAHVQRGQADEALRLIEPRMEAFHRAAPDLRFLGLRVAGGAWQARGELMRAAALFDEALGVLPDRPNLRRQRNTALGERAQVALELGDAAAALQWLERVRPPEGAATPSLQEAARQATRGRALLALGRQGEAIGALREAEAAWLALAAQSPQARAVRRWREGAQRVSPHPTGGTSGR